MPASVATLAQGRLNAATEQIVIPMQRLSVWHARLKANHAQRNTPTSIERAVAAATPHRFIALVVAVCPISPSNRAGPAGPSSATSSLHMLAASADGWFI